jgi:hypothetical protein
VGAHRGVECSAAGGAEPDSRLAAFGRAALPVVHEREVGPNIMPLQIDVERRLGRAASPFSDVLSNLARDA